MDIEPKNIQQCADVAIRLRAEYLFSLRYHKRIPDIAIGFHVTSGDFLSYDTYLAGGRYKLNKYGNKVIIDQTGDEREDAYTTFREFLEYIFMWSSTRSLPNDLVQKTEGEIEAGDVLSYPPAPGHRLGHAITAIDKARNPLTGDYLIMFAQGTTPAVTPHIIKNSDGSPWFRYDPKSRQLQIRGMRPYDLSKHLYSFEPTYVEKVYEERQKRKRAVPHIQAAPVPTLKPKNR